MRSPRLNSAVWKSKSSQQGLWALNPRVTFGSCFGNDIWGENDSVFVDYFWVNNGYGRWWIYTSPLESVSVTISVSVVAQFSLTVSKSTRVGHADDSTRHLWKLFCWLFLSQQGLRALSNPRVTFERCFGDDFWVGTDSVFIDLLWVNKGCKLRIHASPMEVVSVRISEATTTQFSLTISKSTGAVGVNESTRHLWNRFRWRFWSRSDSDFLNIYESTVACALKNPCVTSRSSFGDYFWGDSDSVFVDYF